MTFFGEFFWEKSQENGPLEEKKKRKKKMTRQKEQEARQKNKREDREGESYDSPEIPDRGVHITHPWPPFRKQTMDLQQIL